MIDNFCETFLGFVQLFLGSKFLLLWDDHAAIVMQRGWQLIVLPATTSRADRWLNSWSCEVPPRHLRPLSSLERAGETADARPSRTSALCQPPGASDIERGQKRSLIEWALVNLDN
jgi:hypothetical protein